MDYIIKFDNREKELIKILNEKGYSTELENLDLGDIQFVDLNTKEIIIIIERKTYSDLSASIKDGRYKEQKERLIHSIKNNVRKIILIEGNDINNFKLPILTFNGVVINTMIRDNIHVYFTKDSNETIKFIEDIILHLPKYYSILKKEIIENEFQDFKNFNCKITKKDNITPEVCFRNMLSQIPGVSNNIANIYVDKYKSMNNFINICNKEDSKEKIIELIANEKNNKRKIGNKLAEKIYNNIF